MRPSTSVSWYPRLGSFCTRPSARWPLLLRVASKASSTSRRERLQAPSWTPWRGSLLTEIPGQLDPAQEEVLASPLTRSTLVGANAFLAEATVGFRRTQCSSCVRPLDDTAGQSEPLKASGIQR